MSGVGCSLLPPPFSCLRIPLPIKSWMCRSAVWCELSLSFAHFSVVSFPSNPSSKRLTIMIDSCLSRRQRGQRTADSRNASNARDDGESLTGTTVLLNA